MFHALFALTSGVLNLLPRLARRVLALRKLRAMASRLRPALSSPQPIHLLEVPIAPLELLVEELRTPSSSGGLIVLEAPPLVLPSPIPTRSFQSSLITVTSNRLPDLVPLLLLLVFISVLVLLLPGLVYVCASIANRISARLSRKNSKAFSFKPTFSFVPTFSLLPTLSLVPHFFSTSIRIFSRHLVSLVSLLLLWTGPPAIASFFTLVYIINIMFKFQKFSNMIVGFLQRCGLLTTQDTQTPPVLNAIYEQIINKTVTYNKLIWRSTPPAGLQQEQTQTLTDIVTSSHLDIRYCEQELRASLAQHKLELEEEKQHRLKTERIYSEFVNSHNSLRRQVEVSRTREEELQADLLAAEAERRKLKDLIATLEASDVALRWDLTAADKGARDAAKSIDRHSKLAAEKDNVIRSTTNDLLAVRAGLQDAEDKIARLDSELQNERNLRIRREKELLDEQVGLRDAKDQIARLDAELQNERNFRTLRTKELMVEQTKTRSIHEAEMRRIAKKAKSVQVQLDLLDDILSQSRDHAHSPRLRNHTIAIEPDDTGQPPPPPLQPIPDVHTPRLDPITEPRSPFSPKSLRQTPEHDPPTHHSPDHPRQISACLDRVSDTTTWNARLENLLETIHRLEAERVLEAESRELSEMCLQEELEATKYQLHATQEELAETKDQLRAAQEDASNAHREIDQGWEALRETRAHVADFKRELETCRAMLKDVQDARRAGIGKLCDAVELLRLRNVDLDSLKAEAEASQSKYLQAESLSAVLQKRVTILEAELKSLSRNQKCAEMHPANSQSSCTADTDPIPTAHSAAPDSFHMKLSLSMSYLLDSSLPPSPSPSPSSILFPSSSDQLHTISLDNVPLHLDPLQRSDMTLTRHLLPPFGSVIPSSSSRTRRRSVAFLPVGSSVDSVDWPPIGSTLRPSGKTAEQDSGVSKTSRLPLQEADHAPTTPRNPLTLPLAQIINSQPLGDATGTLQAQPVYTRLTLIRPLCVKRKQVNYGVLEQDELCDQNLSTRAHRGDLSLLRGLTLISTQSRTPDDGGKTRCERAMSTSAAAAAAYTHVSPQDSSLYRDLSHPFGSNDADDSMICVDAHSLSRSTSHSRFTPQSPLPRLLPGLVDPVLLREHGIRDDDSPCPLGKSRKNQRPTQYQAQPQADGGRRHIPTLDYGLPEDFIPGTGCVTPKRHNRGLDEDFAQDFAYLIPLDCATSTPVTLARRLASKGHLPELDVSFGNLPPSLTPPPPQRKRISKLIN